MGLKVWVVGFGLVSESLGRVSKQTTEQAKNASLSHEQLDLLRE